MEAIAAAVACVLVVATIVAGIVALNVISNRYYTKVAVECVKAGGEWKYQWPQNSNLVCVNGDQ